MQVIFLGLFAGSILYASQGNDVAAAMLVPLGNNTSWLSKPVVAAPDSSTIETDSVASGDNVYIVWEWGDVMFAKSSDGGGTFSNPISLANRSAVGIPESPQIAIFQNNIYIVYSSGKDVFLARSTDAGRTFSSPINVSKMNAENDPYSVVSEPIISVSDNGKRVYVGWNVWQQMYFAQSADGGLTFGDHTNVSKQGEALFTSDIASSGSNVYLVYTAGDENNVYHISFASSNDGGHTFQEIKDISANAPGSSSFEPRVALGSSDGKIVYLVWRDEVPINPDISNRGAGVAFAKSTDFGKTFSITRYVASGAWPVLAVSGQDSNRIYIASGMQHNITSLIFDVGFVESHDGGKTFSKQIILSNHTKPIDPYDQPPFPAIASDGANVYVAWRYPISEIPNFGTNHETFLAASYDGGMSFTKQLNVSSSEAGDTRERPFVVAAPVDRVYVFWPEEVVQGNTSKIDIVSVKGQIPEQYNEPFRQVSYTTPVEPYSPTLVAAAIVALVAGIAAGTFFILRRKRNVR